MPDGEMFGTYRLEEKLGEGGMGVVYRAFDTQLDRVVAIKTILTSVLGDAEVAERFVREAKAASRLQHPAIVTIYHVGTNADTRYIVMEYVDGMSLKRAIGGRPMSVNQLCNIAIQLADALALAHEKHVVHRDLKAENVMLTSRMQAKILDFGLAKVVTPDKDVTMLTQVGMVMGTVSHMSPEQALGLEVDGRSDIFSFGVVMYEMATGKMAFDGPSAQATMARVLNQEPSAVGELNPDLPPELQTLIHDCLRKDRNFRPTAPEVLRRLKKIEASLSASRITSPELRGDMPTGPMPAAAGSLPTAAMPIASGARHSVARVDIAKSPSGGARTASGGTRTPAVAVPAVIKQTRAYAQSVQGDPEKLRRMRFVLQGVRAFRIALSLAMLTIPLAFFAWFFIAGGIIKPEVVQGTAFYTVLVSIVSPPLGLVGRIFAFNATAEGMNGGTWNFVALGMGVVTFILRHIVLLWAHRVENSLKTDVIQLETATAGMAGVVRHDKASSHRLGMLREYAEAKRILSQEKRNLAFLAIDVVGSTKMKGGEDQLSIEHAFSEYKKFVERILKQNGVWKVTWTPDGVMCAFNTSNEAVKAAQEVLSGLPWFNDGVHHLRMPFSVRCGVNAGEVVFPQDKEMEEISDEVIDIAGHMQKYATPGTLWLSTTLRNTLAQQEAFQALSEKVDGQEVAEWRPAAAPSGPKQISASAQQ